MSSLHVGTLCHEITHVPTTRKMNRIILTCKNHKKLLAVIKKDCIGKVAGKY